MQVFFYAGEVVGFPDDEKKTEWDSNSESLDSLMKRAVRWSAGSWPESENNYGGVVWVEDVDGTLIDSESVTIRPDGEIDTP